MEELMSNIYGPTGVWFLMGAALVFFMQAGFAMVEAGFTRAKNAGNIIMKNLMDFCIGTVVFVFLGGGLLLGQDALGGFLGLPTMGRSRILIHTTGTASYLIWFSAPPQLQSFPALWRKEQSFRLTAFTARLSARLFIQLKLTGFGAAAG